MSFSSVSVIANALRLRRAPMFNQKKLRDAAEDGPSTRCPGTPPMIPLRYRFEICPEGAKSWLPKTHSIGE
jgi:hypothetical protein